MLEVMHNKPYKFEPLTDDQLRTFEQQSAPVLQAIAGIKSKPTGAGTIDAFFCLREAKAPEESVRVLRRDHTTTLKGGVLYPFSPWIDFYVIRGDYVKSGVHFRTLDLEELLRILESKGVDAVQAHVLRCLQETLKYCIGDLQTQVKTHAGALKGLS
jgi:hypothetical protein